MSEVKGVKELKEVIDALALVGHLVQEVMKDGKINFDDIAVLNKLQTGLPVLLAAIDKVNEVGEEVKDCSFAEAIEVITYLASKVKAVA